MPLVCPWCKAVGSFGVTLSIELPPDGWSDELTFQMVECSACQFRGVAEYRESRRGSPDKESVLHTCFQVGSPEFERLSALLRRARTLITGVVNVIHTRFSLQHAPITGGNLR